MEKQTCEFVPASDIVPEDWKSWFWEVISESNPPFTWGDNNRSLVTASRFGEHCSNALDDRGIPLGSDGVEFWGKLAELGESYIDLEN